MKKILTVIFLLVVSPALSQSTRTLNNYVNSLPSATTPLATGDQLYVIQGGVSKKVSGAGIGSTTTSPTVFNVQTFGWMPDGTDHSAAVSSLLTTACSSPNRGGTLFFPQGGILSTTTIASGSYNSSTGAVTLTLTASLGLSQNSLVKITVPTGTGNVATIAGEWLAASGTGGTTLIVNPGLTGLTMTITGGTVGVVGTYRTDSQIIIPNDGAGFPIAGNSTATYSHQCNLKFEGAGGGTSIYGEPTFSGNLTGSTYSGAFNAAILDLRYNSPTTELNSFQLSTNGTHHIDTSIDVSNVLVGARISASVSGTVLTVGSVTNGSVATGQTILDMAGTIAGNTVINSQGSGSTWNVSQSQTVTTEAMVLVSGGTGYTNGDFITLSPTGGAQTVSAQVEVYRTDGFGHATQLIIKTRPGTPVYTTAGGTFTSNPTGFTQSSTTGGGSGIVLQNPTFSGFQPKVAMTGGGAITFQNLGIVDFNVTPDPTPFFETSATALLVQNNTITCSGHPQQDAVVVGGEQQGIADYVGAPYQGYTTRITGNQFNSCNRTLFARQVAGPVWFDHNSVGNPSGFWMLECSADYNSTNYGNLGLTVTDNTWDQAGPRYVMEIKKCHHGYYANNDTQDSTASGLTLYHVWDGASPNTFIEATVYDGLNGFTSPIAGDASINQVFITSDSGSVDLTGFGVGSTVAPEWNIQCEVNMATAKTNYPGCLIVADSPRNGAAYGVFGVDANSVHTLTRAVIDSYRITNGSAQETDINPGGGPTVFGGSISISPQNFSLLTPWAGQLAYVSDGLAGNCADGTCTTFGTVVSAGGGALHILVWNNGTSWTLIGK